MRKYVIALLLLAFLLPFFSAFTAFAETKENFPRYIQKGDRGEDVLLLQQVLNNNIDTQITLNGSGSPGSETNFFGELTRQAVIKLQKKHTLGSKYGFFTIYSGALDDKTREYLNRLNFAIAEKDPCGKNYDRSNFQSVLALQGKIASLTEALKPENVAKNGVASTTQRWKDLNELYKVSAAASSSAPYIANVEISSKDKDKSIFLPFSSSMLFKSGDQMKITGCNFATSTPNTINSTFSTQKATSTPDGKVITVELKSSLQGMFDKETLDMSDSSRDNTVSKMPQIPTFITVQNDKGTSNPYQIFMKIQ